MSRANFKPKSSSLCGPYYRLKSGMDRRNMKNNISGRSRYPFEEIQMGEREAKLGKRGFKWAEV
jgi:hypothetical protein